MARKPLKFTTAFGVTVMVLGVLLEFGAFFYHAGSMVSAETVFTGAIMLTIGHAFFGIENLFLSLLLTLFFGPNQQLAVDGDCRYRILCLYRCAVWI